MLIFPPISRVDEGYQIFSQQLGEKKNIFEA